MYFKMEATVLQWKFAHTELHPSEHLTACSWQPHRYIDLHSFTLWLLYLHWGFRSHFSAEGALQQKTLQPQEENMHYAPINYMMTSW